MTELAFQKFDHKASDPTLSGVRAAKLFRPFDLIIAKPNGWAWSPMELKNPWFRIMRWNAITMAQAEELMTPVLPVPDKDGVATTVMQRRGFHIDFTDVRIPALLKAWWADDSRKTPIFIVPANFNVAPNLLKKARAAIADPNYRIDTPRRLEP